MRDAKKVLEKGAAPQDYAFGLKVNGRLPRADTATAAARSAACSALQDAAKPFPLQAQVKIGDTSIALAGALTDPLNLGALDLRLKLAGPAWATFTR